MSCWHLEQAGASILLAVLSLDMADVQGIVCGTCSQLMGSTYFQMCFETPQGHVRQQPVCWGCPGGGSQVGELGGDLRNGGITSVVMVRWQSTHGTTGRQRGGRVAERGPRRSSQCNGREAHSGTRRGLLSLSPVPWISPSGAVTGARSHWGEPDVGSSESMPLS